MKTLAFFLAAFILFTWALPSTANAQTPSRIKKILPYKSHVMKRKKEVVFVLTELSCQSTIETTLKFVNEQDAGKTSVVVIAESDKALRYGDRFSDLQRDIVYFMSTDEAYKLGLVLHGPLFAFMEQDKGITKQIRINCGTFEPAKLEVQDFLKETYIAVR